MYSAGLQRAKTVLHLHQLRLGNLGVDVMHNEGNLLVSEAYKRLYPVVRDTNTIKLTDGTNTATLTSTTAVVTNATQTQIKH